jgi:hypothetical protein
MQNQRNFVKFMVLALVLLGGPLVSQPAQASPLNDPRIVGEPLAPQNNVASPYLAQPQPVIPVRLRIEVPRYNLLVPQRLLPPPIRPHLTPGPKGLLVPPPDNAPIRLSLSGSSG